MAGMLPGVELARRRRTNHHSFETSNSRDSIHRHHHHHHHQQRFESSTTSSNMDETALKARRRLEEKLRGLNYGTSRWSKTQTKMNEAIRSSSNHVNDQTQSTLVTERRSRRSSVLVESGVPSPQLDRKNSLSLQREVCSICLEEFGSKQHVMNLPCCHRYHSDCLLPWLNAHSHCPYCRTHVNLDVDLKPPPPTTTTT